MSNDSYNPDVLSCIANLSSDEVFTPPQLVNQILDLLPTDLWRDKKATFLDPGCKSGVFLRDYVYTFISMLAPELDEDRVREVVEKK